MTEKHVGDFERRRFLKMAGATGAAAAVGGFAQTATAGSCGDAVESTTESGSLDRDEGDTYSFSTSLSDPCQVTYSLSSQSDDLDADLYVTLDGRTPTENDYDLESTGYGSDEEVVIDDGNVSEGSEFGVLVQAYTGQGEYELYAEELGTTSSGGGGNAAPDARFSVDDSSVDPGTEVDFEAYDSSDSDGSIVAYNWEFDDGETATGRTAEHAYDEPGEYEVELTVRDDDGAEDTAVQTVQVENEYPEPSISVEDQSVKMGVAVHVDGTGSSDPDGTVEKYKWWFGDGTTATGPTASHTYDESGTYEIKLRVWDNYDWNDTTTKTITVEGGCGRKHDGQHRSGTLSDGQEDTYNYSLQFDDPCEVVLALNESDGANVDLYLTLDGRTPTTDDYDRKADTSSNGDVLSLTGDDVSADTELGILVHAASGGDYQLNVNEWGTVHNSAPTAKIDPSATTIDEGKSVTFDGSSSTDPEGNHTIESYEWTLPGGWGGPRTETGKVITNEFDSSGSHDVTLTVTDEWGRTDTATVTIEVESTGNSGW